MKIDENTINNLIEYNPEHKLMLDIIQSNLPTIRRDTSVYCKTQSQLMDAMLTVSHTTPLRNIRQCLAEIEKTMGALQESYFKNKKSNVKILIWKRELEQESDPLKNELLQIKIDHKNAQIESGKPYISGAIRRITNYILQIEQIKKCHNIDNINELDFEAEEEKYHIQKAFEQGLCSARSHGGWIDEGNQIYFQQMGINGGVAQAYMTAYLNDELELISNGVAVSHESTLKFFNQMADKFKGCTKLYSDFKGMNTSNLDAMINRS
jgi:hypothetical protein